ncbi:MAG TPA: VTT domain-containing protein [Vicinamibacterales bacterium]|jgi:membrane protein YqaA with SNARE-associated domain|nr:VTT domain-containing protein [Vicinamibacterales bacterium]
MTRLAKWIEAFAFTIGGFGIFIITFLDSSFLSFPEVTDFLIIVMVVRHRERMLFYAGMATLGSVLGCLALYYVGLKGEEALLRKRFHERHIDRAMALMRKYGGLALLVPALLPPPAPFKIFVLLAGVSAVPLRTFIIAIAVGRGVRYFGEGIMALLWGEAALHYLHENGVIIAAGLAAVALAGGLVWIWSLKRKRLV